MIASLAMAALAQRATRTTTGNVQLGPSAGGGGLIDMLGPMLSGGQGSGGALGGLLGQLGGLFRK